MVARPSDGRGPHNPDVPPPSGVEPERLDGLPARLAGEGPGDLRPRDLEGEAARERRELLRPHGPDDPRAALRPPGDGTRDRDAETGTFFGRPPLRAACGSVTVRPRTSTRCDGSPRPPSIASTRSSRSAGSEAPGPSWSPRRPGSPRGS